MASSDTEFAPTRTFVTIALIGLMGRLLGRFWPQLMALWLINNIAANALTEIAVRLGFLNRLAGLATLTLVVLVELVAVVAMFETVRPGLRRLDAASRTGEESARRNPRGARMRHFATALTLALVPFFLYYAAWGFLGDAVRSYAKISLDLDPFGERGGGHILDMGSGWWLFASVAVAWAVRRGAKVMRARSDAAIWPIVIVVCEANWAFTGLYVISEWKDEIVAWAAALPDVIGWLRSEFSAIGKVIAATIPPPVEETPQGPFAAARGLFFYALYPLVWLTLAAIVYGYDVHGISVPTESRTARTIARWRSLPKVLRDFIGHFLDGTVMRYRALANGVQLTLGTGVTLIVSVVVLYRLLDWLAAWAWWSTAQAIGPQDLLLWQVLGYAVSIAFGNPSAPGYGLLVEPIKICLLAATIELSLAGGRTWRRA